MSTRGSAEERWDRVWRLFHEILELPVEEQLVQLEERCSKEPEVREDVRELLAAHRQGLPVLDNPAPLAPDSDDLRRTRVSSHGQLEPGAVLADRFEIVRLVGAGGMGSVYEAWDRELESRLAIKTLLPELSASDVAMARFRKEILLARQVTHRNVCRIFDLFQHEDLAFLTMELLEGETLAALLRREGRCDLPQVAEILEQLVAGLEAAHAEGIVHRDLKPSNIVLVDEPGGTRVVTTDFGLATSVASSAGDAADLTRTGDILGTPAYMAPEQLEGRKTTRETDVYALGLLLYEMVSGQRPFEGATPLSIATRRLGEPPPSPRVHRPDLDERWERIILRCLERDPVDRFSTPGQVLGALAGGDKTDPLRSRSARSPAWWLVLVPSALAVALVVVGVWRMSQTEPEPTGESEPTTAASDGPVAGAQLETVLIADFDIRKGDPDLGKLLEAALARDLSNSSAVAVASRGRILDTLRLMRLPPDSRIDAELAKEIAQRDGKIRGVIAGAVEVVGEETVLSARLIVPDDGALLASHSVVVDESRESLGEAVATLARDLRASLGEELTTAAASGRDRERVTTRSLRALRLYEEAEAVIARYGQDATSEEFVREAIREDPEFASAHLLLGYAIFNQTRNRNLAMPHFERAFELADTVPDRERYFIRATYFSFIDDRDRAIANYDALVRLHPDHYWGNNNMAVLLGPTPGIPYNARKATYRPNDLDANWDAAHALAIVGGRPSEATPFVARVVELAEIEIPRWQEYEVAWARLWGAHLLWLDGDLEAARAELDWWAAALDGMSGQERDWMRRVLARSFRTLGLVERAGELLPLPDYRARRRFFDGLDALLLGSSSAAGRIFGSGDWEERWWGDVLLQDPVRVAGLVEADRIDDAIRIVETFGQTRRTPAPNMTESADTSSLLMNALVGRAGEELARAQSLLEDLFERDWEQYGATYFLTTSALADLHRQAGRTEEALALLERAAQQRHRAFPFGTEFWLSAQLDLAELYSELGNEEDAEQIERRVRDLTRLADPEFWAVRRLRSLASEEAIP